MKDTVKAILLVIVVIRLIFFAIKLFDSSSQAKIIIDVSPPISSITGKHYNDTAKKWYTNPNSIQTSDDTGARRNILVFIQAAKLEKENKKFYVLLFFTKWNTGVGKNISDRDRVINQMLQPTMQYFILDQGQYGKLKAVIEQGRKNLSITSNKHGSFVHATTNEKEYEQNLRSIASSVFAPPSDSYSNHGMPDPFKSKSEFIITTDNADGVKMVRFLLPSEREIKLDFFQDNYFEIPVELFKEILID
jgi:hypothetical protein